MAEYGVSPDDRREPVWARENCSTCTYTLLHTKVYRLLRPKINSVKVFTYVGTDVIVVWVSVIARDQVEMERGALYNCQSAISFLPRLSVTSIRLSSTHLLPRPPSHCGGGVQVRQERRLRQSTRIQTVSGRVISTRIGGVFSTHRTRLRKRRNRCQLVTLEFLVISKSRNCTICYRQLLIWHRVTQRCL